MKKLILIAFLPFLFTACGPKIYKSDEFSSVAATHKNVAILPAIVSIQLRPNQAKKITLDDIKKSEQSTGYSVQEKMYGWFLRRDNKMNYTVKFQDVNKTNSALKKSKYSV